MSEQHNISDFVGREVIYCVSHLVSEMGEVWEHLDSDDQEAYQGLCYNLDYEEAAYQEGWRKTPKDRAVFVNESEGKTHVLDKESWETLGSEAILAEDWNETEERIEEGESWQEILEDAGWELVEADFYNEDTGETSDADDWRELCEEVSIDPYEQEVYEHWIVSSWLSERLQEKGETVAEFLGLTIWGRCTTGQTIAMDGVIQEIYNEMVANR